MCIDANIVRDLPKRYARTIQGHTPTANQRHILGEPRYLYIRALDSLTRTSRIVFLEFHYGDDAMAYSQSEEDIQMIVDALVKAHTKIGLTIHVRKTKVCTSPARSQASGSKTLLWKMSPISHTRVSTAPIYKKIDHRISYANASFGRLSRKIFDNR